MAFPPRSVRHGDVDWLPNRRQLIGRAHVGFALKRPMIEDVTSSGVREEEAS